MRKKPWFYKKQVVLEALKELGNAGFDLSPQNAYKVMKELRDRDIEVTYPTVKRYLAQLQNAATPATPPAPAVPKVVQHVLTGMDPPTGPIVLVIVLQGTEAV